MEDDVKEEKDLIGIGCGCFVIGGVILFGLLLFALLFGMLGNR